MRKFLLHATLVALPVLGYGQIFQENFDGNGQGIAAWTVINVDGLTPATAVNFITNGWNSIDRQGVNGNFGGPAGNYAAMSTSWYTPVGTSNDWLISPTIPVSGASPTLYWDAKAQDAANPDGYKVMLAPNGGNTVADFTVELYSTTSENSWWTSRAVSLTPYIGQNVRVAFVNNSTDKFILVVDNIKVDYTFVQPPASYCGPLQFVDPDFGDPADEPITLVNFAGINNTTSNTIGAGVSHEYFLNQTATVTQGQSYNITLKGNTGGNWTDSFVVFIDWNHNGILNEPGEVYPVTQTIQNSDGTDAVQAVHSIAVPANALPGNTRMRVKKVYGTIANDPDIILPCKGGVFGQAEDYTVNVIASNLAVNEVSKKETSFKAYPNPVTDMLNIDSKVKVKSIQVTDTSGRTVLSSEINQSKFNINLSNLSTGSYIVTADTETGLQSVKVIKK
ncbi:T9SS-dependent choice-of-anchor J family protein [Chryseobacterium bernardetii]|uniref:T9SS C-terminal target domain-containing protein n=1 Tax=Chryseobacterium bernardetii TaxID=1241978 RepID=A0A3G6TZ46_9FLAO|nr:choice-of-anchor J domain-containing protein [Chryseobacterium bernardetii]AZB26559.1 T9SS C-terminal target domain-containing protein [Chryseobacterium bernardetii]AZB33049.1 T9SS C-terminal target domain-containing protein [Chryseobacterium bernardetii]